MEIVLEPEQEELFSRLVQAIEVVPRSERQEFMFVRSFQADQLQGNGLNLQVLYEDVIALDDVGLIRVTTHHEHGSGFNFIIPPGASARFTQHKSSTGADSDDSSVRTATMHGSAQPGVDPKAVMVVHGRNEQARAAMFAFLKGLGLRPLEWSELIAGTGKAAPYVGEVLEQAFKAATAVIVLFSPDDEARLRDEFQHPEDESHEKQLTPQARPNVLFEAGMALAAHPDRTIFVELGRLRPFSDLSGRHVVRLDGTKDPLRDIARRLSDAGCAVEEQSDAWDDAGQFSRAEAASASDLKGGISGENIGRRVGYLNEDAQRWIADRDRQLDAELAQRSGEMNVRGLLYSGAYVAGLRALREQALHEYRDEMSRKRRDYADLLDKAGPDTDIPRFELNDDSRETLARWRVPINVAGMDKPSMVEDPTDSSREPDLRRFEEEGDGPDPIVS